MDQRMGRAGRVDNGICYRLIPKAFYEGILQEFPKPAIERESLDHSILRLKRFFRDKKPEEVMSLLLTPPSMDRIERSVLFLKEAHGLTIFKKGKVSPNDGDLTYIG
jgi:HrpA-like RNA helicase